MIRVLIFTDYYFPGFKAGGPINSICSICSSLGTDCDIYLVTRDRDIGDLEPYDEVVTDHWVDVQGVNVMYKQATQMNFATIKAVIQEVEPDTVHLNSLMSVRFSLLPLLTLWRLKSAKIKVLLSPRGELSNGALTLKKYQKKVFLQVFKLLGLDKLVQWIASSDGESNDIAKQFSSAATVIHRVDNLPNANLWEKERRRSMEKQVKQVKLVFCSRISKMKNLNFLLSILKSLDINISLAIYGPQEDPEYFAQCMILSEGLPDNIHIEFFGAVPTANMYNILKEYDLFVLPTLGENFGQIIWEALASSVPVLISDRTPWQRLNKEGVGWSISLESPSEFVNAIKDVYDMTDGRHGVMRNKCRRFAMDYLANNDASTLLRSLYLN